MVAGAMTAPFSYVRTDRLPTTPSMATSDAKALNYNRRKEVLVTLGLIIQLACLYWGCCVAWDFVK